MFKRLLKSTKKSKKPEKTMPFWMKDSKEKINALKNDPVMQAVIKKLSTISESAFKSMEKSEQFNLVTELLEAVNIVNNKLNPKFKQQYIHLAVKLNIEGFLSNDEFLKVMDALSKSKT